MFDLLRGFCDKTIKQVHIQTAGALNDLDGLCPQVLIFPLFLPVLLVQQVQLGLCEVYFLSLLFRYQFLRGCAPDASQLDTDDLIYQLVQLFNAIPGLPITFAGMPDIVMALIPRSGLAYNSSVLSDTLSSAGGQCQTSAAVTAIDIPHQQRLPLGVKRHIAMMGHSFFHHPLCLFKGLLVNDLKVGQHI